MDIGIFDIQGNNRNPLNNKLYSQTYKDLAKVWSTYPAYLKINEILNAIKQYQLLFIISSTGSGKTVIVPKIALAYTNYNGKVIVSLPKKIVTLSAAIFSAKTLDVELGKEVGYIYKNSPKNMNGPENKIIYMTDGSLVMRFIKDPLLLDYKVIIIDEAHERRLQIDLLLLMLKKLLESGKRNDLRVIIMSATISGEKYQNYFDNVHSKIINISGKTNYPVKVNFLDHPTNLYMKTGLEIIENLIDNGIKDDILFFITKSNEAFQLCKEIRSKYPKVYCIEVYADMDKDMRIYAESRDQFLELGNYDQKLIMATNVAESSITIDGLKYVIDSGYELYTYFDPETYGTIFIKKLISKAQALQRRGRVGRTESGICYHLLTQEQFDSLKEYPDPDILRQDITTDLLKIIILTENKTFKEGYSLLEQLMDMPKKNFINIAYKLYKMYNIVDKNDKLTKIGYNISNFSTLPLNRALFLIYSYQLYCAKEASIILSMIDVLDNKLINLFHKSDTICISNCEKSSSKKFIESISKKKGDHLTYLYIFEEFKKQSDPITWSRKYGIRLDILNAANKLSEHYYHKIITTSKAPQLERIKNVNKKKQIIQALKQSHKHLIAKNMIPHISNITIKGKITKDSVVHMYYNDESLNKMKFIYDKLVNINDKWEFITITII